MIFDITYQLLQKELRVRYKNLSLGYLWSLGNPLVFAILYYGIFKVIMKVKIENFSLFLITGLFPWQWFTNSVTVAPWTFMGNASLIKKVIFPRYLLSLVAVGQDLFHFLVSIPVIILFLCIYGKAPSISWIIGIPLLVLIQLALTYGANLFVATINLFFRDMERLIQIGMTFLFYSTPVVFDISMVPEKYRNLIYFNPAASLIISWRDLFLNGHLDWLNIGVAAAWAIFILGIGQFVYNKISWRFAEIL
jgi:lipopolysaccharide transport system permease protein